MPTFYIQKTLTTGGNTYEFNGTNVQISFDDGIEYMEIVGKKNLIEFDRPFTKGDWAGQEPIRYVVDLKRVLKTIKFRGNLSDDESDITNLSGTTATAINKRKVMMAMAEQGGECVVGMDGETLTAHIVGMKFSKVDFENVTGQLTEAKYSYDIDFLIAEDR